MVLGAKWAALAQSIMQQQTKTKPSEIESTNSDKWSTYGPEIGNHTNHMLQYYLGTYCVDKERPPWFLIDDALIFVYTHREMIVLLCVRKNALIWLGSDS
jgi:hypothetical protein